MKLIIALTSTLLLGLGVVASNEKEKPNAKGKVGTDLAKVMHKLWPDDPAKPGNRAPGAKGEAYEDLPVVYVYQPKNPNGAVVVICPGGGYGGHAMDHEGKQIGEWLNSHNITGVVLKYRLGSRYNHPIPLTDAQRAVRYVRANADKLKVDPKRVGILGFSAGGHLASTVATHFDAGIKDAKDPIDQLSCRPDFAVLLYPVITLDGPFAHVGSRNNLLGKNPDAKLVESLCNDKQVTKETPPTFLAHTSEDSGVRPENSVLFYLALKKHGVPAEMHIYEKGRHGLGLGQMGTPFASWPDRCIDWMKDRGFVDAAK